MGDPLADQLNAETPEVIELRQQVRNLERQALHAGDLRGRLADERREVDRLENELRILSKVGQRDVPPAWLTKVPRAGKHMATPWLMLSDLHLDEIVDPAQVLGVNSFNREIALQRLIRTAESYVKVTRDYLSGVSYDGTVLALGGDIFTGEIHDELKETNADQMLGSVDYWVDPLSRVIALLADEFGKVHIPVVVGNHGRTTRKPRAKFRARSNFDWFIGKILQRQFAHDKRVTFDVSDSADLIIPSYGQHVMLTHGDQASGGAGIGGIWPPIMRLDARKRQRQAAVSQAYDLMVLGHWHQLTFGPSFIINGSLKGYDEYAFVSNFGFEPPQQAAWLMTPEHGKTMTFPIFSQDRALEGW